MQKYRDKKSFLYCLLVRSMLYSLFNLSQCITWQDPDAKLCGSAHILQLYRLLLQPVLQLLRIIICKVSSADFISYINGASSLLSSFQLSVRSINFSSHIHRIISILVNKILLKTQLGKYVLDEETIWL